VTVPERTRACPVCGSGKAANFAQARDVEYYSTTESYLYLQCEECGSVFLDLPPVDHLREIYPENYYSYNLSKSLSSIPERVKRSMDQRLFRRLLQRIPGNTLKVLDVGGGAGWLLTTIREVSPRVKETHEIDINERARAEAESAGHAFHCCRVEDFQSPDTFDFIVLLNLIEHVVDPGAVLTAMRKLLSANGLILIKTPNVDTLDCRLFRYNNWGGFHCPRHFVLFNRASIVGLGERCGLRIVEVKYTQGAPQWTCSILGWLGLNGWLRISADRPLYMHPLYPYICAVAATFDLLRSHFSRTAQMFVVLHRQ